MKLTDYMSAHGVSPCDLKDRLGCSEGAVRKWMSGERMPSVEWLRKIMIATDGAVQPNDFVLPTPTHEKASA